MPARSDIAAGATGDDILLSTFVLAFSQASFISRTDSQSYTSANAPCIYASSRENTISRVGPIHSSPGHTESFENAADLLAPHLRIEYIWRPCASWSDT